MFESGRLHFLTMTLREKQYSPLGLTLANLGVNLNNSHYTTWKRYMNTQPLIIPKADKIIIKKKREENPTLAQLVERRTVVGSL